MTELRTESLKWDDIETSIDGPSYRELNMTLIYKDKSYKTGNDDESRGIVAKMSLGRIDESHVRAIEHIHSTTNGVEKSLVKMRGGDDHSRWVITFQPV